MAKRTKQNKNTARQSKAPARVPTDSVTQGTALRAALRKADTSMLLWAVILFQVTAMLMLTLRDSPIDTQSLVLAGVMPGILAMFPIRILEAIMKSAAGIPLPETSAITTARWSPSIRKKS